VTTGRHLERLLLIDGFLRSGQQFGQRHTASTMATALEVSERTVRKDIDLMRDRFNAPIVSTKAKGY
jgi:predicted DNA-binding transcriptional regulator YafY